MWVWCTTVTPTILPQVSKSTQSLVIFSFCSRQSLVKSAGRNRSTFIRSSFKSTRSLVIFLMSFAGHLPGLTAGRLSFQFAKRNW